MKRTMILTVGALVLLTAWPVAAQPPSILTPTSFHGRLQIVYAGPNAIWNPSQPGYVNEIGGFVDDGYLESNLAAGLPNYGIFNSWWPDFWIYGLNLSVGYKSSADYLASNPHLREVLHGGNMYTSNPYAPNGRAMWTLSFYNNTSQMWQGDGPHPTLDGNNGSWPNVTPNPGDRRARGNPFDPNTDNPYETVAWGTVRTPLNTHYVRYDAQGRAPGAPGYDPNTAGFENGGYTVRRERLILETPYGNGVWDFGPASSLYGPDTDPEPGLDISLCDRSHPLL